MTDALAIIFLVLTVLHVCGAAGYSAGGKKPQDSSVFSLLGLVETVVAISLAVAVLV